VSGVQAAGRDGKGGEQDIASPSEDVEDFGRSKSQISSAEQSGLRASEV